MRQMLPNLISDYVVTLPPLPLRRRLAAAVHVARGETDLYARVSFLEGLLRLPAGSKARGNLRGALEELRGEVPPKIWKNPREEEKFFNPNSSTNLDDAIRKGVQNAARKHKYWIGDTGRQSVDEVVQNLLFGLNLATGSVAAEGPIARRTGLYLSRARNLDSAGIAANIAKNSYKQTIALVPSRAPELRGDRPVGEGDDDDTLLDRQVSQWTVDSEADVALALASEHILARIDGCMQMRLSDAMIPVWEAVLSDPSMILTDQRSGKVGIKANELKRVMKALGGKDISASVAARNFKKYIVPALERCFNQSAALRALRKDREIQNAIREDRSRRYSSLVVRVAHRYACGGECPCEGCRAAQDPHEEAAQAGRVRKQDRPKTMKQRLNPTPVSPHKPPKGGEAVSRKDPRRRQQEAPPPRLGPGGT